MAIRFDSAYNERIRKYVKNFNQKRNRMEKAGYKNVPEILKVSDLKARYTSRSELNKELTRLRNFKREDLVKKIETAGGVKAVKWDYNFLKANLKSAREHFQREYERVSKRVGKYPGERLYLDTISAKLSLLDQDINYMNQQQFRSAVRAVEEFAITPSKRKAQYRGFLNVVEWAMKKDGIDNITINNFFKKFDGLTPSQFLYAYDNNPIIERIYNLYLKTGEEARFNTTDENAEQLINILLEQIDTIVKEAKENMN